MLYLRNLKNLVKIYSYLLCFSFSAFVFATPSDQGFHGMGYNAEADICAFIFAEESVDHANTNFFETHQNLCDEDSYSGEKTAMNSSQWDDSRRLSEMAPCNEVYIYHFRKMDRGKPCDNYDFWRLHKQECDIIIE